MSRVTVKAAGETAFADYQLSQGLTHPGVVYSKPQIDFVKSKVTGNVNPWAAQFANLKTRKPTGGANATKVFYDLTWTPNPIAEVGRGSSGSPDQGGTDLMSDMTAALVHAMAWCYNNDRARASKSVEILNAWAAKLTKVLFDTTTWSDGKLLCGWVGSIMGRVVELMKNTGYVPTGSEKVPNWTAIDKMMRIILILPQGWHNGSGGNWIASFTDSIIQLGVALDDEDVFNDGVNKWRRVVPSLFWLNSDATKNPWPKQMGAPFCPPWTMWDNSTTTAATIKSIWGNPSSWPDGLEFEMFRDLHHMAMAYSAIANGAETAWHQGIDLYGEEKNRLVAACELATKFIYEKWVLGKTPDGWPFSSGPNGYQTSTQRATWEIFYNHFAGRLGIQMPNTLRLLNEYTRNNTYDIDLHCIADQLTHQGTFVVS